MAGHSQFKNIMYRKGAQDAKRAKHFTKIVREITVAVKTAGADPNSNPRLRAAILAGRKINMPKDRVEGAIKKASGADAGDNFDEIRYEGYGPGGVAVIVEALTDNRNRTAPEIRSAFAKHGGNLGETGSVAFMFDRFGVIAYPAAKASEEAMLEAAIEAGAQDCTSDAYQHEILCAPEDLSQVRDALEATLGEPESAKFSWVPKNTSPVSEEQAAQLLKLVELLEDNDDVQNVYTNADIPDEIAAKLSA